MADILGLSIGNLSAPKISLTGFFSNTWIYVLLVFIIGVILIAGVFLLLHKKTYSKKIIIFENIAGRGYQPTVKTTARIIKLETGGMEVLKTLAGGLILNAYGKKMGLNTYWFAKGPDGYYYNILLGDLDAKMGMLDIEPVDRDVRMFHAGVDKLRESTYHKKSWIEEHSSQLLMFAFLIALVLGIWFIVGKIGDVTKPLVEVAKTNQAVLQALEGITKTLGNIQSNGEASGGLIPVIS